MKAVSHRVNFVEPAHEHEFEAAHGLPEALPAGEQLIWQGSPVVGILARQVMHLPLVSAYFALLLGWRVLAGWHDGATAGQILWGVAGMLPPIVLALGLLMTLAWLIARTTVYTLTNRRVVMRIGIVLSVTFNLPFARIAAVDWRARGRGGDIVLRLAGTDRIAYLHLWPHARPWHLKQTQPMLRGLPDAPVVARLLAEALRQAEATPQALPLRAVETSAPRPAPSPTPLAQAA